MYYNETKKKIIFLFIYIDSSFIYTIYIRNSASYFHITLHICHVNIIISQYIIIKQNHHIIFKQNHQNHHIIISSLKQNHHIIFKQNLYKLQSYHRNIHITIGDHQNHNEGRIIEIINIRELQRILITIIGSKTHPAPLYINQSSIKKLLRPKAQKSNRSKSTSGEVS